MWLDEDFVDNVDGDGFGTCPDCFDEAGDAKISTPSEVSVGGANDEGDGLFGEDVVSEPGLVELFEDEFFHVVGVEFEEGSGEGDSGFDVFIDAQGHGGEEVGLAEEDEVVVFGELVEHESEFAEDVEVHEVGFVDDGDEGFAVPVADESGLDEPFFAADMDAVEIDMKGGAEDFEGVGVGVHGAIDGDDDHSFIGFLSNGFLDDGLAGARLSHDEAKTALLRMHLEGVEDVLLLRQQGDSVD